MMSKPCEKLGAFADGDLTPAEADAYRDHLADCARCQAGLTGLMQLDDLGRQYLERHGPVEVPWYVTRRRWIAGGAVVALAAAAVMFVVVRVPAAGGSATEAAIAPEYPAAGAAVMCLTYRGAITCRKPGATMLGGTRASGSPPRVQDAVALGEALGRRDRDRAAFLALTQQKPDPQVAIDELAGEVKDPDRAVPPDLLANLGAAYEMAGKHSDALRVLDMAVERHPDHVPARWNRALVYEKLGMHRLAIEDLEKVERLAPDPGWRQEARRRRSGLLRPIEEARMRSEVGDALIRGGRDGVRRALEAADLPSLRRDFYDAVRSRASREDLEALVPLAEKLDSQAKSGTYLASHVRGVLGRNLTRRAPLALRYRDMVDKAFTDGQWPPDQMQKLAEDTLRAGEHDIARGVLPSLAAGIGRDVVANRLPSDKDPWFQLLSLQDKASKLVGQGRYMDALRPLHEGLELSRQQRILFRQMVFEDRLAYVYRQLFDLEAAASHTREGLRLARATLEQELEERMLQNLATIARMKLDAPLARAWLREAERAILRVPGKELGVKRAQRYIYQELALVEIWTLELERARAAIDRALALGIGLTATGAEALSDIARARPAEGDEKAMTEAYATAGSASAGKRALASHVQGRFFVERDRERGLALLKESLRLAREAGPDDVDAQHARAYSYASLIFEAADRGDYEAALRYFGEERGVQVPAACAVALTEDTERSLVIVRDAEGRLVSHHQRQRRAMFPTSLEGVVPAETQARLRPCRQVAVLARPPLQGRPGLLQPDIAWSYRSREAVPGPGDCRGRPLLVKDVKYDITEENEKVYGIDEARPVVWPEPVVPDTVVLTGGAATPGEVLKAMEEASDIDLVTHGYISPATGDSFLLLARGTDRKDKLFVRDLHARRMRCAPLVVLAACHGAHAATALHEPYSLPEAFLRTGARGVLAAADAIPDAGAAELVREVRGRVAAGTPPAVALRDVRVGWPSQHTGDMTWLGSILVFE